MTNNEIIKFLQSKQIPQCGDKEYTADEEYEAYQRAIDALDQQHWINGFCSKCGKEAITEWNDTGGELCLSDYCPNCGAKMESEG